MRREAGNRVSDQPKPSNKAPISGAPFKKKKYITWDALRGASQQEFPDINQPTPIKNRMEKKNMNMKQVGFIHLSTASFINEKQPDTLSRPT